MSQPAKPANTVISSLRDKEGYTCDITAGKHELIVDEPVPLGGEDLGAMPSELLKAALASCTSITLRMYAERKDWLLEDAVVTVRHSQNADKETVFERDIKLVGDFDAGQIKRMMAIADRCPVHKLIANGSTIISKQVD